MTSPRGQCWSRDLGTSSWDRSTPRAWSSHSYRYFGEIGSTPGRVASTFSPKGEIGWVHGAAPSLTFEADELSPQVEDTFGVIVARDLVVVLGFLVHVPLLEGQPDEQSISLFAPPPP